MVSRSRSLSGASGLACALLLSLPATVSADAWLFAPSLAFDQRFDDNYGLEPGGSEQVNATRITGTLGISRESPVASHSATASVDGLLEQQDERENDLESSQSFDLESEFRDVRTRYGIRLGLRQDRTGQDLTSDVTDPGSAALDTGADLDQDRDVARQRYEIAPRFEYDVSRRSTFEVELRGTDVNHDLSDPDDALVDRYLFLQQVQQENPDLPQQVEPGIPLDELTFEDVPVPFVVDDELDDFREWRIDLGWRYALSPITSLRFSAGFRDYESETEPNDAVIVPFEQQIPDSDQRFVLRNPTRESRSETTTLRVSVDHELSAVSEFGAEIGVFRTDTDDSDTLRPDDPTSLSEQDRAAEEAGLIETETGWLAGLRYARDFGTQRIDTRIGLDVEPSGVGSQVESLEATVDWRRTIDPRLDLWIRARAYEPDAIDADPDDEYARRFISLEPRLVWRWSRAVTVAASYRYRRQRAPTDDESGVSNALLFSLVYRPPSALADAVAAGIGR